MTRTLLTTLALGAALSGCAKYSDSIAPAYVRASTFENYKCDQLVAEAHQVVAKLAEVSKKQDMAATGDVMGVLFVGVPVASLVGENAGAEVARLKGEHQALYDESIKKRCA